MQNASFQARSSVIDRILEKGKSAVCGGMPILYIKTDSDVLINQIVTDPVNPLVLLGARTGPYAGRPHTEWGEQSTYIDKENITGYEEGIPRLYKKDDEKEINDAFFCMEQPTIFVQKMPEGGKDKEEEKQQEILRALEKYVVLHQDKTYENHALLRSCVVLLYASSVTLTPMLKTRTMIIDVDYPDENTIKNQIRAQTGSPAGLTDEVVDDMTADLRGFDTEEISVLLEMITGNADITSADGQEKMRDIIRDFKNKNLEGGLLELISPESEIGGMDRYQKDLDKIVDSIKRSIEYCRKKGVNPPKGDLLMGIPGCGKSELAKFTAKKLGLILLKLDMGKVMNKYQGESERMMRATIKLAESMSPCMLFLDELEKGLSGSKKDGENDAAQRMFGFLLGWMQDHTAPVYIFATANDISGLPKELFRSGRFRNKYAVYLPTEEECISIFQASMRRVEKTSAKAQGIPVEKVRIFEPGCDDREMLRGVIRKKMIREDGTPRIMIGSDIGQIVETALRSTSLDAIISDKAWEKALMDTCDQISVEGDSEENVDYFASSYCRLLRKGFTPTADYVLFDKRDYRITNLDKMEARRQNPEAYSEQEAKILQRGGKEISLAYDKAVYDLLYERINRLAPYIERNMLEMITR